MKKTLMAGTALVASGVLLAAASGTASAQAKKAEKIKLGLGGYMEQWFGYSDQDIDGFTATDQKSDSEIYIKGSTTLDNGIQVGVVWELEGDSDPDAPADDTSNRFDEAFLFVSGSFGRIILGEEDTASELMGYGPSIVGPIGLNKTDANDDWMRNNTSVNLTHNMDLGMSDNHAISYYSPRIAGFQFGASYHPTNDNESANETLESTAEHQGMSAAANYVGKFGDVSVAGYVGFATKEATDSAGGAGNHSGWGTGASVGFGGFTVGAAYISENEAKTNDTLSVGVRYRSGMNAFSVGYVMAEQRVGSYGGDPTKTEDQGDLITLGYERTLGPGVTWGTSVAYADWDAGGNTETDGAATADNDGFMVVTGIKLDF